MKLKVKYLADITPIKYITGGDWIDLRTACDIHMAKNEARYIPLGVAIQVPEGYEAIIVPRSSTFKRYNIIQTNSIGVIDESYCGDNDEWKLPVYAIQGTDIPKDTRIAQFRIVKHQPEFEIETVDVLGNEDRGGFGSTGTC